MSSTSQHKSAFAKPTVEIYCCDKFFVFTVQVSQEYAKPTVYKYIAEIRFLITVKVNTRVCKDYCAPIYC
jgi:hypothetical protein